MTIEIKAIKADREAGTDGPWTVRTLENFGWNVVHYRGGDRFNIERVAKSPTEDAARRISRVPDMEAALIEMAEALERIIGASDYYGKEASDHDELTLAYAHQSTRNIARAVLSKHVGDG